MAVDPESPITSRDINPNWNVAIFFQNEIYASESFYLVGGDILKDGHKIWYQGRHPYI